MVFSVRYARSGMLLGVVMTLLIGEALGIALPPPKNKVVRGVNHTDLEGDTGIFKSPNFPDTYPESANVTWMITIPEDKRVELTFHLLNIEKNHYCSWDWVKIFDAETFAELRQLCGYLQQDLVLTFNTSSILVEFRSDSVSQLTGFLASWRPVDRSESTEVEPKDAKVEGYILTIPQSFTASDESPAEEICLEIFNVDVNGKVFVNILSSDNILNGEAEIYKEIDYTPGEESQKVECFTMKLPSNFDQKYAIIQINGTFEGIDYRILSYKSVKVLKGSPQILVQTDKREYRPKQKVMFRIIKLDESLRPSKNNILNRVFVKSPSRQILSQHLEVKLDPRGIGQFEYELDEEPELGDWEITVENDADEDQEPSVEFGSFIVNEAVLPKFEVQINGPNVILSEDGKVDFEICGVYTHGSKVKGSVEVFFEHRYKKATYWRAPNYSSNYTKKALITEDNACAKVNLNQTEVAQLSIQPEIPFSIKAKLTEKGTEIVQEATSEEKVAFTRAEFDFGDSALEHIIGEYPYVMSFKLVEQGSKNPLRGESVEICSRLWRDINKLTQHVSTRQFHFYDEEEFFSLGQKLINIKFKDTCVKKTTSMDDGSVTLGIPLNGLPGNVTKLSVKVTAINFKANETTRMKQTSSKHDVTLTHLSNDTIGRDAHRLTIREKLIEDRKVKFDCEGTSDFTVYFQGKLDTTVDLNYVVSSGGSLITSGNHRVKVDTNDTAKYLDGLVQSNELGYMNSSLQASEGVLKSHVISLIRPFPMEGKITKIIKILIYTRDIKSGQTLSHVREYETETCAPKPTLEWIPSKSNPGHSVDLKIMSKPSSLCAYSVIDKSADLIENPFKITSNRIQDLREDLARKRIVLDQIPRDACKNAEHLFQAMETIGLYILSDKLLQDPSCSSVVDSANFDKSNKENDFQPVPVAFVSSISASAGPGIEMDVVNRGEPNFDHSSNTQGQFLLSSPVQKPAIQIRDYFPETWLFDLVDLESNEEVVISREAPHTITTWVAEAFCSNPENGLSVADRAQLSIYQDFFADLNSPYSAKRGEILQVNATVFNKVEGSLPMKLSLEPSENYKVMNKSEEFVCVKAGGNVPVDFYVQPNKLDVVNLTIKAEIVKNETCGIVDEASIGYMDVLKKAIHVRPEGLPKEEVKSYFLCGKQKETTLEDTVLPETDLVEDSVRSWFGISGDIMAPAVKNLDSLVALPTGCGEQTMIRMVPNIYLLDYLKSVGKSLSELEAKAKRFIQAGFNRQNRKFRHRDGSYSIWGPKDREEDGSMWLTAYVVKAFSQASKYIDVDKNLLKKSVNWIIKRQDFETGCFHNEGYAYSVNSPRETLTSHVLVTLFEARYTADLGEDAVSSKVIFKAFRCLKVSQKPQKDENNSENPEEDEDNEKDDIDESESLYALSLKTYAIHLLESKDELKKEIFEAFSEIKGEKLFKELMDRSQKNDKGYLHWQTNSSRSRSVEMTAYNVMTLLFNNKRTDALSAIRWISDFRNDRGGFISTQDTVVALQAISRYSTLVYENETSLDVELFNKTSLIKKFTINEENKLLFERMKIDELQDLKVTSSGKGCYTFSTMVRYNIREETEETPKFQIRAEGNSTYLHICASYIGTRARTNMVLLEAELLTSYEVVEESLARLLNEVESGVEKYEVNEKERNFVLYFDGFNKGETSCWDVELKQVSMVENLKPALIKIFDYYSQEDTYTTTYII